MHKLTNVQSSILDHICSYSKIHCHSPSSGEIAEFFNISKSCVQCHIRTLIRKGYLCRKPYSRNLVALACEHKPAAARTAPVHARRIPGKVKRCNNYPEHLLCNPDDLVFSMDDDFMQTRGIRKYDYLIISTKQPPATGDFVVIRKSDKLFLRNYSAVQRHLTVIRNENFSVFNPLDDPQAKLIGKLVQVDRHFDRVC